MPHWYYMYIHVHAPSPLHGSISSCMYDSCDRQNVDCIIMASCFFIADRGMCIHVYTTSVDYVLYMYCEMALSAKSLGVFLATCKCISCATMYL